VCKIYLLFISADAAQEKERKKRMCCCPLMFQSLQPIQYMLVDRNSQFGRNIMKSLLIFIFTLGDITKMPRKIPALKDPYWLDM
jgi:hypothetical protein